MRLTVNTFSLFLFLFFLFLNLQTLTLTGFMVVEESSVKFYHIFSLFFLPLLFLKPKNGIPKIPPFIFEYFVGIIVISLLLFLVYPFNRLIVNHLFAFYAFFIGYYVAGPITQEQVFSILQKAALLLFIVIVGKLFFHIPEIQRFMKAPDGHPDIYTIYGGGTNLEATWMGLNTALFINRKRLFYILFAVTLAVSVIYASRVGVVITFLVAGFKFISATTSKQERIAIIMLGLIALLAFVLFIDLDNLAEKVYALQRFTEFGSSSDKGLSGRFAMWRYYGTALWDSKLLGYGAGNGIYAIESISRIDYQEDNLHNLYMQLLIEFGIIGLFLYLIVVYNISIKALKSRLSNPIAIIIMVYFIASLIQFRGTDALIWLFIGLFLKIESNKVKLAGNE
ncbi:O-antigen ligase family protein [Pontibacter virosus]|uniref:O-antigen ligase n=1 Tax=Pontibacter virosus TaxID=1765052 RepID=A0A2U1ARR0_9BACT|nr:O-antigen ligase family protein [Pontibacter virosus]PVY39041.1 O-antigen ligase [Pontibacter virosus]